MVAAEEDGCEVLDALMDLYMALLVGQVCKWGETCDKAGCPLPPGW